MKIVISDIFYSFNLFLVSSSCKMNPKIMASCLRCLFMPSATCRMLGRFALLQLRSMTTGHIPASHCITLSRRHYANDVITETSGDQSMNEKYLSYLYVATSKTRWIEFEKGCMFDVGIFDSFVNKTFHDRVPVIVGVPGCVGTHDDLVQYLYTFVMLGYRVIIPNIPGSKYCKGATKAEEHIFTMTDEEKAEFIKDTLETIQVPHVDILVTHSDSVYTGLHLTAGLQFKLKHIKALVLIDPTGLEYTKAMRPLWIYQRLSRIIETNRHLSPVLKLIINIVKLFSEKRRWSSDDVISYARNISAFNFEEANLNAQRFRHRPIPMRVFYGKVGSSMDVPSTEKLLEIMGAPKSNTTVCDENCQILSEGVIQDNRQCFYFIDGQTSDAKRVFIRTELLKFLKTVRPDILEL